MMIRYAPAFLLFCLCATIQTAIAQTDADKYHEAAESLRKEIWGWDRPEFTRRAVPAEYAKYSKVVLARRMDVSADSKKKIAFRALSLAAYRELALMEVLRESVKLNDQSAVSEYSEISYTQLERKGGFLMDRTTVVYLGIKVIKPNGEVREINADDIVLTKDQKKKKEAKIAVPDLQAGDIVDYFIAKQTNMSQLEAIPPYLFLFYDEVPVMHCSMHFEVGKKYAVEYRSYNGAPEFKTSKGEDNDNVLDIVKENIPAVEESSLWTAPFRQLPLVRLNILLGNKGILASRLNARKPGELYKNQESEEYLEDKLRRIANRRSMTRLVFDMGKTSGEYLKQVRKNRNKMSTDSLARELFYIFRFDTFLDQTTAKDIRKLVEMSALELDESLVTFFLGEFLKAEEVDNYMVYATLNKGPRMKEILSSDDLNSIIMVRGGVASPFYGFGSIFTNPSYLPYYFEGANGALIVNTRGPRETNINKFEKSSVKIPVSKSHENGRIEQMEASLSSDPSLLEIKRKSVLRGHYKSDEQQRLILFEDYYNAERKYFNDPKTLIEKLSDGRKTKKFAEELESAFAEARTKNKESFLEEARSFFSEEIKEIKNYKVDNMGVRHTNPDLVYSSEIKMDGLVKKAGSSYIIDIGKLQGGQLSIEGDQRKRKLDVYAPFPRSLEYDIRFAIPQGYAVEGLDALNKRVENAAGSFICEATNTGQSIILKVRKSYNHAFEPVANWENMLAFIDAAKEWSNSRIVLKKNG